MENNEWQQFMQVIMVVIAQFIVPFAVSIIKQDTWSKVQKFWLAVIISVFGGVVSQGAAMLASNAEITPATITTAIVAVFIASQAHYKSWFSDLGIDDYFNPSNIKSLFTFTNEYTYTDPNSEKIDIMLSDLQDVANTLNVISASLHHVNEASTTTPIAPDINTELPEKSAYVADDMAHEATPVAPTEHQISQEQPTTLPENVRRLMQAS